MKNSVSLLPQSPEGILQSSADQLRVVSLMKELIDVAISAFENFFIYQNANEFDGHVGDTLCQIRAYHVYSLISNPDCYYNHFAIAKKFKLLQLISYRLSESIKDYHSNNRKQTKPQSVISFFHEHNLVCDLSEIETYLIQLHLLSRFKCFDSNMIASIDYKRMCNMLSISKTAARRIVHNYQINVSQYSVNFIYSLIAKQSDCAISTIVFNELKKTDEEGRLVLPSYWVIDIMYKDMLRQKCPILVVCKRMFKQQHIDTIFIAFIPSNFSESEYKYCQLSSLDHANLCFILDGVAIYDDFDMVPDETQYREIFIKEGIKAILFANMAIHPQYAGKKLSEYKDSPYLDILKEKASRFDKDDDQATILQKIHYYQQEMKSYALSLGCGKQNPSFFYIRHIFCDSFGNQIKLDKLHEHEIIGKSFDLVGSISNWNNDYFPVGNHSANYMKLIET